MSQIKEIVSGVYQWSTFSEEKGFNFNGLFIVSGNDSFIIDPPDFDNSILSELKDLISKYPTQAILLTNVHHDRASQKLKSEFGIPIWINENDAAGLDFEPDKTFEDNEILFGIFRTITFKDQKSPGETGLLLESRNALILGDALIGKKPGAVNMLPADKFKDIEKAKQGLKVLNDYKFETLLLGDGESILENAGSVTKSFLGK